SCRSIGVLTVTVPHGDPEVLEWDSSIVLSCENAVSANGTDPSILFNNSSPTCPPGHPPHHAKSSGFPEGSDPARSRQGSRSERPPAGTPGAVQRSALWLSFVPQGVWRWPSLRICRIT